MLGCQTDDRGVGEKKTINTIDCYERSRQVYGIFRSNKHIYGKLQQSKNYSLNIILKTWHFFSSFE